MTPERWERIVALFDDVLAQPADERGAFLRRACGTDEALQAEVERLLQAHAEAGPFLEEAAIDAAQGLLDPAERDGRVGRTVGRYRIDAMVEEGGMGQVFRATDIQLGRPVALKLLPPEVVPGADGFGRLQQEARAASALNHPNIVTVYEVGEADGIPFIAAEYVEGRTLRQVLQEDGTLPADVAVEIGIQIAAGLAAAHEAGIVHRDIKPENVMLRPDGYVKIVDFGIAQAGGMSPGMGPVLAGTRAYMSPEQLRGGAVDHRSDLWSVGVLLYELVAGRHPFGGGTATDLARGILEHEPPPLPRAAGGLADIVRGTLRKEPEERCASAAALLGALRGVQRRRNTRRLARRAVVATLAIAAAALAAGLFVWRAREPVRSGAGVGSILVLPFRAAGGPQVELLADGLAEGLIHTLSGIGDLRVVGRSTAFRYRGWIPDPLEVGRELAVDAVLMGRISERAGTLAVEAGLVRVSDGRQLWSREYSRSAATVLPLQAEISGDLAARLRSGLPAAERARLSRLPTRDPAAHALYLKGRLHEENRTQQGLRLAVQYFEQAVEQDPLHALAWAGMASSYFLMSNYDVLPPREACPKARAAARRALEIDGTLAEAHAIDAMILLTYDWDLAGAGRAFDRALQLSPHAAGIRHWHAMGYLYTAARFDAAVEELARARELDPLSPIIATNLGWSYARAGRHDEAVRQLQATIVANPRFAHARYTLGVVHMEAGRMAEAIEELQRAADAEDADAGARIMLAAARALGGHHAPARQLLGRHSGAATIPYLPPYFLAVVALAIGDHTRAFELLERAYEARAADMIRLHLDPLFRPLHGDPRFEALLRRVGVAPR